MANNNPDFHGGPTQSAPTFLGQGTKVKRTVPSGNTSADVKPPKLGRTVNNMGPGPSEDEGSAVDPESWDAIVPMNRAD